MTAERSPSLRPEVAELLGLLQSLNLPDFADMEPEEARQRLSALRAPEDAYPAIHRVDELSFPGLDGADVAARLYRPSDEDGLPVLVWFHGGGWVLGDLDAGEIPCRSLANEANCAVLSVDYRLAPENPFPVPFEDCLAATRWVAETAAALNLDGSRIAVGGDSAGGNLAACVAVAAAAEGLDLAYQVLVYPVVAADFTTPSYKANAEGYFLTARGMEAFWDHYTTPEQRSDPRVAPLEGSLAGLAPAWVFSAGYDPLADEVATYADALEAAGIPVVHRHMPDVIHGVFSMTLACSAQARSEAAGALAAAFAA